MFGAVIILKKSFQKKLFQKKCKKALFKKGEDIKTKM